MKQIVIAGVGGQGSLLASKVLGRLAINSGHDVHVSEVHGMSQRGGSVITFVRISEDKPIYSSLVEQDEADVLLSFELLEAYRALPRLKKDGVLIVNKQKILPIPVITGAQDYPLDIMEKISEKTSKYTVVDAKKIANDCGNHRVTNVVLLGMLSKHMGYGEEAWKKAIKECVKEKFVDINLIAFDLGRGYSM